MKSLILIPALFSLSLSAWSAPVKPDTNELLYQYCHVNDSEFEQSVVVGQGSQVMYHQGPFMQVTAKSTSQVIEQLMIDKLALVSESQNCAQYLLSRASLVEQNLKNKVIARVLFDFDKDELNKQSRYLLWQLAAKLEQQVPELTVTGNTDSQGRSDYNLSLGLQRSQAVMDYLQAQGVDIEKAVVRSNGELTPIETNDSETGRKANRRSDIQS